MNRRQEMARARADARREELAAPRPPRLTKLAPGQHLESRYVLAGAYRGSDIGERALLTHAVLVEGVRPGRDLRTLCSQPVDNVADTYSDPDGVYEAPTCSVCLPRWERLQESNMERNGTIYEQTFELRRGYLLVEQEITGPNDKVYAVDLEYQVFDAETGAPVEDTRRVKGERRGDLLIIGDPHRDTRLFEYKVDLEPTRESKDIWQGFRAAMGDRQWHLEGKSKKYYGQSQYWWDGYNEGQRQKRDPNAGYERNGGHARASLTPNSERRYYVWVLLSNDIPKDEGPYGPYEFLQAKDFARIAATEGEHDRAVSIGVDPQDHSFQVVRRYRARSGERIQ